MHLDVSPDKTELGRRAAAKATDLIRAAINAKGHARVIVATGASQFATLDALVDAPDVDWQRVTCFHLDEYVGLPVTHPASFRKYLWERFARRLPLPLAGFVYVEGDAADAEAECRRLGDLISAAPIDVALVGIGENAHLAFNDPPADFETARPFLVVTLDDACRRQQYGEGWFGALAEVPTRAISMSCRQILASAAVVASVPDARKAEAVKACVEGPVTPDTPASVLQRHGDVWLYLDRASAGLLDGVSR